MTKSRPQGLTKAQEEKLRVQLLLDVASKVFLERGFHAARMTEIASRANASIETFYSRFPSKQQLFIAVVEREMQNFSEAFAAFLDDQSPLREVLIDVAGYFYSVGLGTENIALLRIIYSESTRFPEIGKAFVSYGPERDVVRLSHFFSKQMLTGALRDEDPMLVVEHFIGLVYGQTLQRALAGILQTYMDQELTVRIEKSVDVFLAAYSNSQSKS